MCAMLENVWDNSFNSDTECRGQTVIVADVGDVQHAILRVKVCTVAFFVLLNGSL